MADKEEPDDIADNVQESSAIVRSQSEREERSASHGGARDQTEMDNDSTFQTETGGEPSPGSKPMNTHMASNDTRDGPALDKTNRTNSPKNTDDVKTWNRPQTGSSSDRRPESCEGTSKSCDNACLGGSVTFEGRTHQSKKESTSQVHQVTFTVTIAKAFPTGQGCPACLYIKNAGQQQQPILLSQMPEIHPNCMRTHPVLVFDMVIDNQDNPHYLDSDDEDVPDAREMWKKKRRIVEAPRAQNYFHTEYYLLPDDEDAIKTDVVTFGLAAKLYTEKQEPKVLKTWIDGDVTWVAWAHSHTVVVTDELLLDLFDHKLELRIWDTKDKVSTRARFDRPKAFRLPQPKPGDDPDAVGGVRALVQKQSRSFENLQASKSSIERPLPSQSTHSVKEQKAKRAGLSADSQKDVKRSQAMPNTVADFMVKTSEVDAPTTNQGSPGRVASADGQELRDYSQLAALAGVQISPEEKKKKKKAEKEGKQSSKSERRRRSVSGISKGKQESARKENLEDTSGGKKTQKSSSAAKPKRTKKGEAAAQAALEHAKKYGIAVIPIRMSLLFAGLRTVTNRLDKPVPGLQDVFLTVSLEGSLMSEEQKRKLNPMIVKVHSVTNLPDTPLSYEELSRTCLPVTTAYKFFKYPEHISEGKEHAKNMYWDDLSVFLAGTMDPSELREYLQGPPLEIRVHDRNRKPEEDKLKPTLFGDDLEDEKISNVGAVSSKRTVHNPFQGRDAPWDPHGVARFDLSGLLLGERVLQIKAPIFNSVVPDVLGVRGAQMDTKLMGVRGAVDGPVDTPMPAGHYLQSGASLKVKVEVAYPLLSPEEVASKEDSASTLECPYSRLVYKFDYRNVQFLTKLQALVMEINARALELDNLPQHVIEAALSTYKLSIEQQKSRNLDIVTGFQILDGTMHLFVLEGLQNLAIKNIWQNIPKPENSDVEVLYHSQMAFGSRLYGPLDVDLTRIKLHEPMSVIIQQPLLYVRDMVPKPCFEALVKLNQLCKVAKLRDAVRNELFPTAEMVVSMSREFGVPLTSQDFEELEVKEEIAGEDPVETGSVPTTSRNWTPIDNYNHHYDEMLGDRDTSQSKDFMRHNKELVHEQSFLNKQEKAKTMPLTLKSKVKVAHNYSTQALNSTEQAKERLRQELSQWPDHRFTYCQDYHHSMTVVPVNVDAEKKEEKEDAKAAWKTSAGWTYPGKKTMQEANIHGRKPDVARTEELTEPFVDNILHANVLEPTLDRTRWSWDKRHQDVDLYRRPYSIFNPHDPITIHLAGEKLKQERKAASKSADALWRSKVMVDDTSMQFHRCLPETELAYRGRYSSNQLARLKSMLKEEPEKYSLRKAGFTLEPIPPLSVVLNPSVDAAAREAGLSVRPAVEGEGEEMTRGFMPGPYTQHSWSLERNRIPAHDYNHNKFILTKGQDFNVYHREKSVLHKLPLVPLADNERDNHLFQIPDLNREDVANLTSMLRRYRRKPTPMVVPPIGRGTNQENDSSLGSLRLQQTTQDGATISAKEMRGLEADCA